MSHSMTPSQPERRTFFHWLTYMTGAAATAILGVPLIGFLFGALRKSLRQGITIVFRKASAEGQQAA